MYGGNTDSGNLNNRYQSYQQGGSYVPPGRTYAEKQTNILQDSVQTQFQAEEKANAVLSHMHVQRHQLQGARDDVWEMQDATAKAKREIADLAARYRRKRHRLYAIIAVLSIADLLLFVRLVECGGSFFC